MIRSDAARNRAKVLQAAEAVLDEQGLSARMDEIAHRAGVGVGTVYRHFATKETLYQAIVTSRVEVLLEQAERLKATATPARAFFTFFAEIVADAARKKALTDALHGAGIDIKAQQTDQQARMRAAITDLLRNAQRANAVRHDVDLPEILALLRGASMAAETGDYSRPTLDRSLAILFAGLRREDRADEKITPICRTENARASAAWYARLGFATQWEHRFEPGFPLFLRIARGPMQIFLSEHRDDARPDTLLYLHVGDVEAVAAEFEVAVEEAPWGREVHLRDPDGNRLRVGSVRR